MVIGVVKRWIGNLGGGGSNASDNSLGLSLPTEALIERIADTGMTVPGGSGGSPDRVCRLTLQVTPVGGLGNVYTVEVNQAIPRHLIPKIQPGLRIPVTVDTKDRTLVVPNLSQFLEPTEKAPANTDAGITNELVPISETHSLSSNPDRLLATGARGVATITGAMPFFGRTVGEVLPAKDPAQASYPLWLLKADVKVADEPPFQADFGTAVPPDMVGTLKRGVRLEVAVNPANKNHEVAVDWARPPVEG